jgi:hypothetical protein
MLAWLSSSQTYLRYRHGHMPQLLPAEVGAVGVWFTFCRFAGPGGDVDTPDPHGTSCSNLAAVCRRTTVSHVGCGGAAVRTHGLLVDLTGTLRCRL